MRMPLSSLSLLLMVWTAGAQPELLNLDFNHADSIGDQAGDALPDAVPTGDIAWTGEPEGVADFGARGYLSVEKFVQPSTAFSIEARFMLHDYGTEDGRFTMQMVGSLDSTQGWALRVGAGSLYPKSGSDEWLPAIFSGIMGEDEGSRSQVSACVGAIAFRNSRGDVMETYTRHCLETRVWIHMVAVWDGTAQRIYVNGHEDTDTSRAVGIGGRPLAHAEAPMRIGAGILGAPEARHFNGRLDFVRILGSALTGAQIRERFAATPTAPTEAFDCHGVLFPTPVMMLGGCREAFNKVVLGESDSLEIQFSREADFRDVFLAYRIPVPYFRYLDHYDRGGHDPARRTYWRAKVVRKDLPVRLAAWDGSGSLHFQGGVGASAPALFRLDGTRVPSRAVRAGSSWRIEPLKASRGLYLVRQNP